MHRYYFWDKPYKNDHKFGWENIELLKSLPAAVQIHVSASQKLQEG